MQTDLLQTEIKAQPLRLVDVFLLAPLLIYAGTRRSSLSNTVKSLLVVSGISIAVYEAGNYLVIRSRENVA